MHNSAPANVRWLSGTLATFLTITHPFYAGGQTTSPDAPARQAGIRLYTEGKTQEAIDHLRRATMIDKSDGEAWYFLGLALVRMDDMSGARKALAEAVKLQPEFAPGHTALAYALMARTRNEEAEREARVAIQLNQNDAMAHYVLGSVQLRFQRVEDADHEADIAILQGPTFGPAYLLKSQALVAL